MVERTAEDHMEHTVRAALHREAGALDVAAPDVHRLRRDAFQSNAPARTLTAAACLLGILLIGVAANTLWWGPEDVVAFGSRSEAPSDELTSLAEPATEPPSPPSGDLRLATEEDLRGRTFESVGPLPGAPIPDAVVTLEFGSGDIVDWSLVASSDPGCNAITGGPGDAIDVDSDGRLSTMSPWSETLMDCDDVVLAQDEWLSSIIRGQPRLLLGDGAMVIDADEIHITLQEAVADTPSPVVEDSQADTDAPPPPGMTLPIPTFDSHGIMLAPVNGQLRVEVLDDAACAYLGEQPVAWPLGYRVDAAALSVIDMQGNEVAETGDFVEGSGGYINGPLPEGALPAEEVLGGEGFSDPSNGRCGAPEQYVAIQGDISRAPGSAPLRPAGSR